MPGGRSHARFLTTSTRICMAVRHFEMVRRGICRHLQWPYELPLIDPSHAEDEMLWVALRSTCGICHPAFVSLPKATYLVWKHYAPFKCVHEGELWSFEARPASHPTRGRRAQLPRNMEPVYPQQGSPPFQGEITLEVL